MNGQSAIHHNRLSGDVFGIYFVRLMKLFATLEFGGGEIDMTHVSPCVREFVGRSENFCIFSSFTL